METYTITFETILTRLRANSKKWNWGITQTFFTVETWPLVNEKTIKTTQRVISDIPESVSHKEAIKQWSSIDSKTTPIMHIGHARLGVTWEKLLTPVDNGTTVHLEPMSLEVGRARYLLCESGLK